MMLGGSLRIGVLVLDLAVPGARSLKDRRRAVVGLRDRIRSRFDVSCHEVHDSEQPTVARLLVTTGGLDAVVVGRSLDKVADLAARSGDLVVRSIEREVIVRRIGLEGLS